MTPQFFRLDFFKEKIERLPHLHRVAFAASICERMLPMYNNFYYLAKWGNLSLLKQALDEVWVILQGRSINSHKINKFIDNFDGEGVWPDSESDDFCDAPYLFEAQFTVSAIYAILNAILEPNVGYIIVVVENARFETIEGLISQREKLYEVKDRQYVVDFVANDPLAKQEMAKEMEDLERLKNAETLSPELLEWLRTTSTGKSLIELWSV